MTGKNLRVLSIDFDLFQMVSTDILANTYPDGIDLKTEISKIVWLQYYANPRTYRELIKVKINRSLIEELKKFITNSCRDLHPDILISNSHLNIYPFIHEYINDGDYEKLYIDHLDMHHDLFNGNSKVDCGNWLAHIRKEIPTDVRWIHNRTSEEMYNEKTFKKIRKQLKESTLADIKDHKWDIIFLCRSDAWFPPHLDGAFERFAKFLMALECIRCRCSLDVYDSRWDDVYQYKIEELRMQFEKMYGSKG